MTGILQDVRYALRGFLRNPGFTAIVVLTLGLGIGANTSVFSLVNAILLQAPAGVVEPERLVDVYTSDYSGPAFGTSSYPDFRDFAADVHELSGLAAFEWQPFNTSSGGEAFRTFGEYVTGDYFRLLGLAPALGRLLDPNATAGNDAEVVLSYALWQQRFGGANDIVGRAIRLRGQPLTVIGVAPRGFEGTQSGIGVQLWVPYSMQSVLDPSARRRDVDRGARSLYLIGRLAPGAGIGAVRARFEMLAARLHAAYPQQWSDLRRAARRITVLEHRQAAPLPEIRGAVVGFLTVLGAVAALVLLISCANLANLLLTRAAGRAREIAIRATVGATRGRIMRQLLMESVLLASAGGICGIVLAAMTGSLLGRLQPPIPVPISLSLAPSGRTLLFAGALAAATGILLGTLPALRATRGGLRGHLHYDALPGAGLRRILTLRNTLVVGQIATSSALLVVMGLFVQSLLRAQAVDLGFRPNRVALATLDLDAQGYGPDRAGQFLDTLENSVRALPGVRSATFARFAPLGIGYARRNVRIQGYESAPNEDMEIGYNVVDDGYFATLGIELLRGRAFGPDDRSDTRPVAIVNDAFVRRYWPDGKALGRHVDFGNGPAEVVGVTADAKYRSIREKPLPYVYAARRQVGATSGVLEARTAHAPSEILPALRTSISRLDPGLAVRLTTMNAHLGIAVLPQRIGAILIGLFGCLGLLLAALGLYGLLAYLVAQRTHEIGIRMALGSDTASIIRLVLKRAAGLTAVGLAVGLAGALAAGRLVAGFLFGVSAADPWTFATVAVLFATIAFAAAFAPARRATKVDPTDALRCE